MSQPIVAIVGGGAAGMLCAATIIEHAPTHPPRIVLFEKNKRLGAKVIISGGGRCNVTTGTYKRTDLHQKYTRGADFLDYAFRQFGPKKVRKRFEDHGVPLKQEADGRIFPVSDNGKDIVALFECLFAQHKVSVHFQESVQQIRADNVGYTLVTNQSTYQCSHVIIATGGEAYAHTGSTGDGYSFARQFGHTITPLGPSLNSFMCAEKRIHACTGISFEHARLHTAAVDMPESVGPVLLTHFGISGPETFVLASHTAFEPVSETDPLLIRLQPDSNQHLEDRDRTLLTATEDSPQKSLINTISRQLPKRFVEELLHAYQIDARQPLHRLTKVDRKQISKLLGQGIPLTLIKRRPGDEFVTAGGIDTDEVDPQTMQSTLSPGLFFVGEVLNVDGVTGGYNLQASWATGYLAGKAVGGGGRGRCR